jgi:hypothetical protein
MLWSYLNNNRKAAGGGGGEMSSTSSAVAYGGDSSAINDAAAYTFYLSNQTGGSAAAAAMAATSATDRRASILYCQLNELLPGNLCEDIICTNLRFASSLAAQIDAFKRFTRLWHWSREYTPSSSSTASGNGAVASSLNAVTMSNNGIDDYGAEDDELPVSTKYGRLRRTFERALLILIDMLAGESATSKTMSKLIQDWLLTCIYDYNDLPRIMDTMLVSLLHPGTARVSVQHFLGKVMSANSSKAAEGKSSDELAADKELDYESKVYAISNEGGNVKYHVNGSSSVKGIN